MASGAEISRAAEAEIGMRSEAVLGVRGDTTDRAPSPAVAAAPRVWDLGVAEGVAEGPAVEVSVVAAEEGVDEPH